MRRLILPLLAVAVVAAVIAGLSQAGGGGNEEPRPAATVPRIDASKLPPELARLVRQGSRIVPATPREVQRRIEALRGTPVVVNKWASWCGPCRYEFPFFQQVAAEYAGRVAFIGLNSGDNRHDARAFLKRFPVPYPSFEDPDEKIALALDASAAYPVTIFYDASGTPFVHQGSYATAEKLEADLRRHALS